MLEPEVEVVKQLVYISVIDRSDIRNYLHEAKQLANHVLPHVLVLVHL